MAAAAEERLRRVYGGTLPQNKSQVQRRRYRSRRNGTEQQPQQEYDASVLPPHTANAGAIRAPPRVEPQGVRPPSAQGWYPSINKLWEAGLREETERLARGEISEPRQVSLACSTPSMAKLDTAVDLGSICDDTVSTTTGEILSAKLLESAKLECAASHRSGSCTMHRLETLAALLEGDAVGDIDPVPVDVRGFFGETPLANAAGVGFVEGVQLLLRYRATVDLANSECAGCDAVAAQARLVVHAC
jgi:hypothetical protein